MQQLISVILPAYNVEPYLPGCLDSLLAQENGNLEIIVVDDGSRDRTAEIAREYAERDPRIRWYTRENGGIGAARNTGIEHATGEWLAFIDADDQVTPDYFSLTAEELACEVIQKPVYEVDLSGRILRRRTKPWKRNILQDREELLTYFISACLPSASNKIVRRDVLGTHRFDTDVRVGEDLLFTTWLMQRVRRYAISGTGAYRYLINPDATVRTMERDPRRPIETRYILYPKLMELASSNVRLQRAIVARYLVPFLYHSRRRFTAEDCRRIRAMMQDIRFTDLHYLTWNYRAKWYLVKIILSGVFRHHSGL